MAWNPKLEIQLSTFVRAPRLKSISLDCTDLDHYLLQSHTFRDIETIVCRGIPHLFAQFMEHRGIPADVRTRVVYEETVEVRAWMTQCVEVSFVRFMLKRASNRIEKSEKDMGPSISWGEACDTRHWVDRSAAVALP